MRATELQYAVLYRVNLSLCIHLENVLNINTSDIVSISLIHNYDAATYPIIRIRLYSDIRIIEQITMYPDEIQVLLNMDANTYQINDKDKSSPKLVAPASNISLSMKGYIENKNTPVSFADQYTNGLPKETNLNTNIKVPIEIYCYNQDLIHHMKYKPQSIYKDISIQGVIEDILKRHGIYRFKMDSPHNQNKYNQILIPNLDILKTISFLNEKYGLYQKGGQIYGDIDQLYICNTDVNYFDTNQQPLTIYVTKQSDTNTAGMVKLSTNQYGMATMAQNVSLISETEIERVLNAEQITTINFTTLKIGHAELKKLYGESTFQSNQKEKINVPDIPHHNISDYVASSHEARLNESITKIDVSGFGFDVGKMKVNRRYGFVFESPIRGLNVNQFYRSTFANHVFTNLTGELFYAQTTMNLVSN